MLVLFVCPWLHHLDRSKKKMKKFVRAVVFIRLWNENMIEAEIKQTNRKTESKLFSRKAKCNLYWCLLLHTDHFAHCKIIKENSKRKNFFFFNGFGFCVISFTKNKNHQNIYKRYQFFCFFFVRFLLLFRFHFWHRKPYLLIGFIRIFCL